jgi:hypothetical protein
VSVDHALYCQCAGAAEVLRLIRKHDAIDFRAEHTSRIAVCALEKTYVSPVYVLCQQRRPALCAVVHEFFDDLLVSVS